MRGSGAGLLKVVEEEEEDASSLLERETMDTEGPRRTICVVLG